MGTKYAAVAVSGYNATPPSDDGTVSESNKVKWSTIKTKLPDPLKTALDSINSNLVTHFDRGPVAVVTNTTLLATHYGQMVQVSGSGVTLTLTDAATLTAGWFAEIVSTDAANSVTLARATAADTINETSANVTILPLQALRIMVNAAADGFLVKNGVRHSKAAQIGEVITVIDGGGLNLNQGATGNVWSTGDCKLTLKNAADTGWVLMNDGSIGSATSGATTRANADTEDLFTLLWDNVIDTWAPVSTGRGASAAADFAANKTITLPLTLGRVLSVSGTGAGLTARALGENLGEESHVQTEAELDPHGHNETYRQGSGTGSAVPAGANLNSGGTLNTASDDTGSGTAFNVMQPASFCNVMIKL